MTSTYAERLFGQVDVRDLGQLAAEYGDGAVVGDGLGDAGEGLHEIGEASGGENLCLPCTKRAIEMYYSGTIVSRTYMFLSPLHCLMCRFNGFAAHKFEPPYRIVRWLSEYLECDR